MENIYLKECKSLQQKNKLILLTTIPVSQKGKKIIQNWHKKWHTLFKKAPGRNKWTKKATSFSR